jgi:CDP-glucose 4,6-dehydratase
VIYFGDIYRGRRVLITGHTGFKGSWLSLWLLHLGADVAGYSIDVPTTPSNFELLKLGGRIKHYQGDVKDAQRLTEVIDEFRPEIIFHLAAQALVRRAYADPVNTFETNVMGMVNLLECIRNRPWIEVAVLITSDKAYRNDEWCWGYRETDVLAGKDPYSGSKSCAELVAHSYIYSFLQNASTRVATTRAGNVIGGGDWADDRIVPDCIKAWAKDEVVSVRSPQATRPWQHVLEPLSGYLLLGEKLWKKQEGINGEAFNFGPSASVDQTVAELLDAMCMRWKTAKWEAPIGFEQSGHEAKLLKLSCDKVLHYLSWQAQLNFQETVNFTLDWYQNWHSDKVDNFEFTINQIKTYCELAIERNAAWVQTR